MLIEIEELERHPIDFREELPPGAIDFGPDAIQSTVLKAAGRAQLVQEHHGKHQVINDIRLDGELSTSLKLVCARCLEPVVEKVGRKFDLLYRPQGADAGKEAIGQRIIEVPENVGNLNWGGDDWSDLYMPSTSSLYRISMKVSGNRLSYMT